MIVIHKNEGETMGGLLDRAQVEYPKFADESMTFAGRLDPLASGACIILVGDERFEKEKYTGLSKTYKVSFLEGVETDTLDPLGLIVKTTSSSVIQFGEDVIKTILLGNHILPYPNYSSKNVDGKPLWQHTRENSFVEVPQRVMSVNSLIYEGEELISSETVIKEWQERIQKVNGDFRQQEILQTYSNIPHNLTWRRVTLILHVASGTYIRSLTQLLKNYTQTPWIAEYIERTHIDEIC
ncbi:MAG TPA: hypothetical protein VGE63_00150 [Candidatus Paceibacterota bacterium]